MSWPCESFGAADPHVRDARVGRAAGLSSDDVAPAKCGSPRYIRPSHYCNRRPNRSVARRENLFPVGRGPAGAPFGESAAPGPHRSDYRIHVLSGAVLVIAMATKERSSATDDRRMVCHARDHTGRAGATIAFGSSGPNVALFAEATTRSSGRRARRSPRTSLSWSLACDGRSSCTGQVRGSSACCWSQGRKEHNACVGVGSGAADTSLR
jgi:hypothetical protein